MKSSRNQSLTTVRSGRFFNMVPFSAVIGGRSAALEPITILVLTRLEKTRYASLDVSFIIVEKIIIYLSFKPRETNVEGIEVGTRKRRRFLYKIKKKNILVNEEYTSSKKGTESGTCHVARFTKYLPSSDSSTNMNEQYPASQGTRLLLSARIAILSASAESPEIRLVSWLSEHVFVKFL